jgi:hypothetical protein
MYGQYSSLIIVEKRSLASGAGGGGGVMTEGQAEEQCTCANTVLCTYIWPRVPWLFDVCVYSIIHTDIEFLLSNFK